MKSQFGNAQRPLPVLIGTAPFALQMSLYEL